MQKKVAVVTGGAQGIGLGIVQKLVAQDWRVAVLDCDQEALQACYQTYAQRNDQLLMAQVDVADEDAVQRVVAQVHERFGRIDGLVNNAGIAKPESGPVEDLRLEDWHAWLNVDLTGPMLLCKHSVAHLRVSAGAIVNIASTRAWQSEPNCEAYAAAKGGLVALSHALAISLAGQVRVNSISPGWIAVDDFKKPSLRRTPDLSTLDHQQHPAGRVGRPADVANLCAFLLSEQAGFITGEDIIVDGGMTRKMIYQ